jgi:hypothetical protein
MIREDRKIWIGLNRVEGLSIPPDDPLEEIGDAAMDRGKGVPRLGLS